MGVCSTQELCPRSLAGRDVQTNGRRVVVLEVVQVGRASVRDLVANALASGAVEGGDLVRVTRGDGESAEVLSDVRGVIEGRLSGSRRLQLRDVDLAVAAEGIRRGLEVGLLREEEDERASLALVRVGNVEVEDRRDGVRDRAEVRGALSGVGLGRVNGHDQVRVLVVAGEVSGAGRGRGGRGRRRSLSGGWRRSVRGGWRRSLSGGRRAALNSLGDGNDGGLGLGLAATSGTGCRQGDVHAVDDVVLVGVGVDVVFAGDGFASNKVRAAGVLQLALAVDGEATCGCSTNITLELRGGSWGH